MIRDALSEALRAALPADQWEHFAAEAEARVKRRQEAVILLLIDHLDNVLYLSLDQREQISRSMADHWQNGWEGWMQLRNSQNVPDLPAEIVAPYLEPDQRQAWERIPKVKAAANSNSGVVNPADLAWWDEAAPAAKDANADVPAP